jgi:hypothetical protein
MKIVGSVYVYAMLEHLFLMAAVTICSGLIDCPLIVYCSQAIWLICQFWQNSHLKLQPGHATEKLLDPG